MVSLDLTNAPDEIRGALVNIFVLPFWYIILYLFHRDFFLSNDTLLIIAFCLCFTIVGGIMMAYISFFSDQSRTKIFSSHSAIGGILLQIIYHSLLVLLLLSFNTLTGREAGLKTYLVFYFAPLLVFLIASFRGFRRSRKKVKK